MNYTTVRALRDFSYSEDGVKSVKVAAGDALVVRGDLLAGLLAEGYAKLPWAGVPGLVFGSLLDSRVFASQTDHANWLSQANGTAAQIVANCRIITYAYASLGYNCTGYNATSKQLTIDATSLAKMDAVVAFAQANALQVHLSHLFWADGQLPGSWFTSLSASDALDACKKWIDFLFARYDGKVTAYTVVNENYAPGRGTQVSTAYATTIGIDWWSTLCQYARTRANLLTLLRPKLIWCEYATYYTEGYGGGDAIRAALLAAIDAMPAGTLDAFGEQGHIRVADYDGGAWNLTSWATFVAALKTRGLGLWVTEFDVLDGVFTKNGAAIQYADQQLVSMATTFIAAAKATGILQSFIVWGINVHSAWATDAIWSLYNGTMAATLPGVATYMGTWQAKTNTPVLATGALTGGAATPSGSFYAVDDATGAGTPPTINGISSYGWWLTLGSKGSAGGNGTAWVVCTISPRSDGDYTHGVMYDSNGSLTNIGRLLQVQLLGKSQLDYAVATATPGTLAIRDTVGRMQVASPSAQADVATKAYVDARPAGPTRAWLSAGTSYVLPGSSDQTLAMALINRDPLLASAISGQALPPYYGGARVTTASAPKWRLSNQVSIGQKWQLHFLFKMPSYTASRTPQTLFLLSADYSDTNATQGAEHNTFVVDFYYYATGNNYWLRVYRRDSTVSPDDVMVLGYWPISLATMYQVIITYDGTQGSPPLKMTLNGVVSDPSTTGGSPAAPANAIKTAGYNLCANWYPYVLTLPTGWGSTADNAWMAALALWTDIDDLTQPLVLGKYWDASASRPLDITGLAVGASRTPPLLWWNSGAAYSENTGSAGGSWNNSNPNHISALSTGDTNWLGSLSSIHGGDFTLPAGKKADCYRQTVLSDWFAFVSA